MTLAGVAPAAAAAAAVVALINGDCRVRRCVGPRQQQDDVASRSGLHAAATATGLDCNQSS